MKIKVEQANYNDIECDMEVFNELYHGEEDNDYLSLIAFLASLDDKQRDDVLRAISVAKHYAEKDDDDNV